MGGFRGPLLKPSERRKASSSTSLAPQKRASAAAPKTKDRYEFLKNKIHKWVEDWTEIAAALKEIHDDKLYKNEYGTFEKFCDGEFDMGQAYAYRLLEALSIKDSIAASPMGDIVSNERQARALSTIKETKRVAVLNRVAKSGPVTAKAISEATKPRERRVTAPKVIDVEPEGNASPQPSKASAPQNDFIRGVVYACARLIEMYDQPTMAVAILRESGAEDSDLKGCAEYDLAYLRKEDPKIPRGVD